MANAHDRVVSALMKADVMNSMAIRPDPKFATIIKEHVLKIYGAGDPTTERWRSLPEIPDSSEILGTSKIDGSKLASDELYGASPASPETRPDLPINLVDRPWTDSASYIAAHYQLLREDAVYPLRKAVAEVKADPFMKDTLSTAIYLHVHMIGITLSTRGPAIKVEFSYENAGKRIRWGQSTRLQQGTIVALTPRNDMFKSICKVAVVAARPLTNGVDMNPPRVDLFWGDWDEAEFDPTVNWVMVESRSGYWESFRHMGVALQKLRSETFPLSKYLVNLQNTIDAPDHIKRNPYTNMTSLHPTTPMAPLDHETEGDPEFQNVDVLQPWPKIPSNLDESQLEATNRILTKQIGIVQGPPGTGKTFVSISSLKVMLQNWVAGDPPIIVSAQTNHALDQLLLLLAPYVPEFIRLGGRTADKTGVIKKRTIYEVRQSQAGGQGSSGSNIRNAQEKIRFRMMGNLKLLVNNEIPTGLELLELGLITQEQFDSLHDQTWATAYYDPDVPESDIFNWVGKDQMCHLESKCPPINTSFEEEELDDFETLNEEEAESVSKLINDEIETLKGAFHTLEQSWVGERSPRWNLKKTTDLLNSTSDLWDIPNDHRGEIYNYFMMAAKKNIRDKFRADCKEYMRCVANSTVAKWEKDARMITRLKIKVIGCTTTGLSKYRGLLAALKPRTLLIEEAAETVEGTVLAAIFESLDQLILVGDHKQLQAKSNRDDLSKHPYNLAISMFERLVKNGIQHTMLNKQRRMITEIRRTFTHVYAGDREQGIKGLSDHQSVLDRAHNRPPVPGMAYDLFFFSHAWPESRMDTSKCNHDEADMIVNFFDYLVMNGVEPSQISILTFYKGQKKVLQKQLRSHHNLRALPNFNVFTVDSYQGEENHIILLSLVRSNDYQENGFLEVQNRVVVSLSRARRGLYVFGNALSLVANREDRCWKVWSPVLEVFRGKESISENLPLTCKNHNNTTYVKEAADFEIMKLIGGCEQKCQGALPCGHSCPHNCHPFEHERIICKVPCEIKLTCGHECNENCGDPCCCLQCGPLSDEEYLSDHSEFERVDWSPADFKESLLQAISSTPIPGLLRPPPPSVDVSSLHPRKRSRHPSGNKHHGTSVSTQVPRPSNIFLPFGNPYNTHPRGNGHNVSRSAEYVASVQEYDTAIRSQRVANRALAKNDPSGRIPHPIMDIHQRVIVNGSERISPEKAVRKEISSQNSSAARPSSLDKTKSVSGTAAVTMGNTSAATSSGTSQYSISLPRMSLQHENSHTATIGLENLSLIDSTEQKYVQSLIDSPVQLPYNTFASDLGTSSNAIQTGVMGDSIPPPTLTRETPPPPMGPSVPQAATTDSMSADDGLDLLSFD